MDSSDFGLGWLVIPIERKYCAAASAVGQWFFPSCGDAVEGSGLLCSFFSFLLQLQLDAAERQLRFFISSLVLFGLTLGEARCRADLVPISLLGCDLRLAVEPLLQSKGSAT